VDAERMLFSVENPSVLGYYTLTADINLNPQSVGPLLIKGASQIKYSSIY
jgi:hypothetical protein